MDEADEVEGTAVVSGGKATEMLEATEAPVDLVAMFVDAASCGMAQFRLRFVGMTAAAFMPAIQPRKSLLP